MTLLADVEPLLQSFNVVSERQFRLLGRTFTIDEESDRDSVVAHLAELLYLVLHCRNNAVATRTVLPRYALVSSRDFTEGLSAANCGTGAWQPGWSVCGPEDGDLLRLQRGEVQLLAGVDDFRSAGPATAGTIGLLRFPNEHRGLSVGHYVAVGNRDPSGSHLLRLYWHIVADGGAPLISAVTRAFNAADLPFEIKVLTDPEAYHRTDAGVLYVPMECWDRARPLLADVYAMVRRWIRAPVSAYACSLAPGLGLGENPPNDRSFGEHRSEVLAAAFLRVYRDADPVHALTSEIADSGLALDRFYANAGSTNVYDPL